MLIVRKNDELRALLGDQYDVVSMREAGFSGDIEEDGTTKYVIVEVKADNQIDDLVVQAKKEFASQTAVASGMEYMLMRSTDADASNVAELLGV